MIQNKEAGVFQKTFRGITENNFPEMRTASLTEGVYDKFQENGGLYAD